MTEREVDYVRPGLQQGFHPPEQCARGRTDCRSLAQIVSSGANPTFMCCGEVAPGATPHAPDAWAFCHRSDHSREHVGGVDIRFFVDRRDISHMAGVLSMALAIVIPADEQVQP